MYPILFEFGGVTVYAYGFLIAIGAIAGVIYMARQGKREVGLTFDQANTLFLFIFLAAFIGGKVFLFFEDVPYYLDHPKRLLTGRGFVFYGSFLFAIPVMLLYFRKHKLPVYTMLDVMAVTTCLVHMFGRLGCFFAGCCYGVPTDSVLGVTFTHESCYAEPLGTPLHPTQLYESVYIGLVMVVLLIIRDRRKFHGQLFFLYLMLYACGRFVIEYFRGDLERGFIVENWISHSQFIAILIFFSVLFLYVRKYRQTPTLAAK
jgi:phosphatidylglycerol---prolipoprotein diacylglyceryl transferase